MANKASRQKQRLLCGCAIASVLAIAEPARAQNAFDALPTVVSGSATINGFGNTDTITVATPTTVINWAPRDTAIGGGPIVFLPSGATGIFVNDGNAPTAGGFTVLNRVVPIDATRAIRFDGTVVSTLKTTPFDNGSRGGAVWFYSPGGIIAGSTSVFDVGSLVLTTSDPFTTGSLLNNNPGAETIQFVGTPNSTSAVQILAGASITASPENSYVAIIAPNITQAGTVTVNGSAAYVAAESVDVRIRNGLFDIVYTQGRTGGGTAITHTGTTTGPAPTGSASDNHLTYFAALPKNDAITMLIGGTVGYTAAGVATRDARGNVILAAGIPRYDRGIGATGALSTAKTNVEIGTAAAGNVVSLSTLSGDATGDITINPGTGGVAQFNRDVTLTTRGRFTVGAEDNEQVLIGGSLTALSENEFANTGVFITASNSPAPGPGGLIQIGGNLSAGASAFTTGIGLSAEASILVSGGTLSVGGSIDVGASQNVPAAGQDPVGGIASFTLDGGTVNAQSLSVGAFGSGEAGGTGARGGSATLSISGGTLTVTNAVNIISSSFADVGTTGAGGTSALDITGGTVSLGSLAIRSDANVVGAEGFVSDDPPPGDVTGGTARLNVSNATVTINGAIEISATGLAEAIGSGGAIVPLPGDARGGNASFTVTNSNITGQQLILSATGIGGSSFITASSNSTGGTARLTVNGGNVSFSSIFLDSSASGGDGFSAAPNEPAAGGGSATGGTTELLINGGTLSLASLDLAAIATGGRGGSGDDAIGLLNGGAGGAATGGTARVRIDGTGQLTLVSGEGGGSVTLFLNSNGFGGGAGDAGEGGVANDGGAGTGGASEFIVGSGTLAVAAGRPPLDLALISDGFGGDGGSVETGYGSLGLGTAGAGGFGRGGNALFSSGQSGIPIQSMLVSAAGFGDDGGDVTSGGAGVGGGASGGVARVTFAANASVNFIDIDASAEGGEGGDGLNGAAGGDATNTGTAELSLTLGNLTTNNTVEISANAIGGEGGFGAEGGRGGAGGSGTGGLVSVVVGNGNLSTVALDFSARGQGQSGQGGQRGTDGANGTAGTTGMAGAIGVSGGNGDAGGAGGTGGSGGVGGAGGNGGIGRGGTINVSVTGGSFTSIGLNADSSGTGGDGATGGDGGAGGAGGTGGTGGAGASTFASGVNGGNGGNGGAGGIGGNGGVGGNAGDAGTGFGGAINFLLTGGTLDAGNLSANADGKGGFAGNEAPGGVGGIAGIAGAGGARGEAGYGTPGVAGSAGPAGAAGANGASGMPSFLNAAGTGGAIAIRATGNGTSGNLMNFSSTVLTASGLTDNITNGTGGTILISNVDTTGSPTILSFFALQANALGAILGDITLQASNAAVEITSNANLTATRDILVQGNGTGALQIGGELDMRAGFFETGYGTGEYRLGNATVDATVSATNGIEITAGDDIRFGPAANVESDNLIRLTSGDDIIAENGARIAGGLDPIDTGYGSIKDLIFDTGVIEAIGENPANIASFIAGNADLSAPNGAIRLTAEAVSAGPANFAAKSFSATIRNAPAVGVTAGNDSGQLSGACLEGNICVGNITADTIIALGPETGTADLPNRVLVLGDLEADDISIRARDTIGLGTDLASSAVDADDRLLVASLGGNLTIANGTIVTGNNLAFFADGTITGRGGIDGQSVGLGADAIDLGSLTSATPFNTVDSGGTITTAGTLAVSGTLAIGAVRALSGPLALSGAGGIALGTAISTGNATLNAVNGSIRVSDNLNVAGVFDASGRDVSTNSTGSINARNVTATAGNIAITSGGNATLSGTIIASGNLNVTARDMLTIDQLATGSAIDLRSSNIAIAAAATIGEQGRTASARLANTGNSVTTVGGNGVGTGYSLANAELQRVFANDILIVAPRVTGGAVAITGMSLTSRAPDIVLDALTLTGANGASGATAGNIGSSGRLRIETPGKLRAIGAVAINSLGTGNRFEIAAADAIEIDVATGSISLRNANGGLGGTLALTSEDVIAASLTAMADVRTAADITAIDTRLGRNDGAASDDGYLRADAITVNVSNGFYVQNSGAAVASPGTGTTTGTASENAVFDARRGLTVGNGGLSITVTNPAARIVVNGRQLVTGTGSGTFTGLGFLSRVQVNGFSRGAGTLNSGLFDSGSTINGCRILGATCSFTTTPIGPGNEARDIIENIDENARGAGGNPLPFALVEIRDVEELGFPPVIDDPVTGSGNDDLYAIDDDDDCPDDQTDCAKPNGQ